MCVPTIAIGPPLGRLAASIAPPGAVTRQNRNSKDREKAPAKQRLNFEANVLGAVPQNEASNLRQVLPPFSDGQEMVPGKLAHLAGEGAGAERKQDFRLAESEGIKQDLSRRG